LVDVFNHETVGPGGAVKLDFTYRSLGGAHQPDHAARAGACPSQSGSITIAGELNVACRHNQGLRNRIRSPRNVNNGPRSILPDSGKDGILDFALTRSGSDFDKVTIQAGRRTRQFGLPRLDGAGP